MAAQSAQWNQAFCVTASDWSTITSAWFSVKIKMDAPMEVTQKLLYGSSTSWGTVFWGVSLAITQYILKFCLKFHFHVICHIHCQVNIDYHNQHESAALIGLFRVTSSVLPSVESCRNYQKPTQRSTGVTFLSAAESTLIQNVIHLLEIISLIW